MHLEKVGHIFRIARDDRTVPRVLATAPNVDQILRMVVHDKDV